MAYEFTKLADVPALEEVPEGANAFIEVDGEVRRVPGDGLGGGGGIPTAIIHLNMDSSNPTSVAALADLTGGTATASASDVALAATESTIYTGTCDNMTYDEAKATLLAGEPLDARVLIGMDMGEAGAVFEWATSPSLGIVIENGQEIMGVSFSSTVLSVMDGTAEVTLYWLTDGTLTSDINALKPGE